VTRPVLVGPPGLAGVPVRTTGGGGGWLRAVVPQAPRHRAEVDPRDEAGTEQGHRQDEDSAEEEPGTTQPAEPAPRLVDEHGVASPLLPPHGRGVYEARRSCGTTSA
jgi:hypothetical protein